MTNFISEPDAPFIPQPLETVAERVALRVGYLGALLMVGAAAENEAGWQPELVYGTASAGIVLAIGGAIVTKLIRVAHRHSFVTEDAE